MRKLPVDNFLFLDTVELYWSPHKPPLSILILDPPLFSEGEHKLGFMLMASLRIRSFISPSLANQHSNIIRSKTIMKGFLLPVIFCSGLKVNILSMRSNARGCSLVKILSKALRENCGNRLIYIIFVFSLEMKPRS